MKSQQRSWTQRIVGLLRTLRKGKQINKMSALSKEKQSSPITSTASKIVASGDFVAVSSQVLLDAAHRKTDSLEKKYQAPRVSDSEKFDLSKSARTVPNNPEMQTIFDSLTGTVDISTDDP